ncbi:MAG: arylsulfatase [Verrucomicrobia bacterium]|nr:arylsulfatase [Verrucomicrobiota bacterium]MDA1065317.1 arylsulfatase [Verrucomicrobiota bacterium]
MTQRPTSISAFFLFLFLLTATLSAQDQPNVILIIADDIGFSDIGSYGSEIETPHLDKLAYDGLRFRNFYNMSKCEPTRSSLFTGRFLPGKHIENAIPFSTLMHEAGYYTAMVGKEHLMSWVPARCFAVNSFEDSFVFWKINSFWLPPSGEFEYPFRFNGVQVKAEDMQVTREPLFKTDVMTDYALKFLDKANESKKPFFLYLPYHEAHYPLQAREEDIAKYRGKYKVGWDNIRAARFARQKELGVIPVNAELSPPEDNINNYRGPYRDNIYKYRPWDSLDEEEQDELDLEQAVFAAMVDGLDQNIGRVLEKLDQIKERENTLIIFFTDNGSCPYDSNVDFDIPPGGADSYRTLSAAWANVGDTPYRFYKQYGHEGGAHTHMIANWPGVIEPGFSDGLAHLTDIYPTMLELAGAEYPDSLNEKPTPSLDGESLMPLLKGESRSEPDIIVSGHGENFRMVRVGDWKLVRVNGNAWELYNLAEDPTELDNLAENKPEKVKELIKAYEDYLET